VMRTGDRRKSVVDVCDGSVNFENSARGMGRYRWEPTGQLSGALKGTKTRR